MGLSGLSMKERLFNLERFYMPYVLSSETLNLNKIKNEDFFNSIEEFLETKKKLLLKQDKLEITIYTGQENQKKQIVIDYCFHKKLNYYCSVHEPFVKIFLSKVCAICEKK